jgi:hypothetical protein
MSRATGVSGTTGAGGTPGAGGTADTARTVLAAGATGAAWWPPPVLALAAIAHGVYPGTEVVTPGSVAG